MKNQTFLKKLPEIYEKFCATPGLQARVFRITLLASADANDALRVIPALQAITFCSSEHTQSLLPLGQ